MIHHAASLLTAFLLATWLAFFLTTRVRAEGSPTAVATASPAATPVTPLPPRDSSSSSQDDVGNGVKYFVIGLVVGIFAILAVVLVVLWFVID